MAGRLVVCATPIGNLGDITLRVLEALSSADVIAAEDTRVTRKLLSRHDIHTPMEPYHAHNLDTRTIPIVERIRDGTVVALVSDAGTPGVSDPGARLVSACLDAGLPVEVLPGPSAIIAALVASGLPTHSFHFAGFLPRKPGEIRRVLASLSGMDATLVFYESPRRAARTAALMAEVFPGRSAAMARELTKMHEEILRAPIEVLSATMAERELKGEVVLLVGPPPPSGRVEVPADELAEAVRLMVEEGTSRRDAIREVARRTGARRSDVFRAATEGRGGSSGP